eukprot:UC1_evm3s2080
MTSVRVSVTDPVALEAKIQRIRKAGTSQLHVIADFDYTLTRFAIGGVRCASTHRVLEESPILGADFSAKTNALFKQLSIFFTTI